MPRKTLIDTVKLREVGDSWVVTIPSVAARALLKYGTEEVTIKLFYRNKIPVIEVEPNITNGENNG